MAADPCGCVRSGMSRVWVNIEKGPTFLVLAQELTMPIGVQTRCRFTPRACQGGILHQQGRVPLPDALGGFEVRSTCAPARGAAAALVASPTVRPRQLVGV